MVQYTEVYKGRVEEGNDIEDHFFLYQIFNIQFNILHVHCLITGKTFSHHHRHHASKGQHKCDCV